VNKIENQAFDFQRPYQWLARRGKWGFVGYKCFTSRTYRTKQAKRLGLYSALQVLEDKPFDFPAGT